MARPAMALRAGPYGPVPAAAVLALGAVGSVPPGMGVVVQATDATEIALFSQGRLVASQLVPAPNASEPAVLQRSLQRQLADELFEPEHTTLYRWSLANGHAPAVDELGDAVSIQILSLFPGFVMHQIRNSLAARQIVPKGTAVS